MGRIDYLYDSGLARITLTSSSGTNPIDQPFVDELFAAVQRAQSDDAAVVLVCSDGKAFSVGGDIKSFASAEEPGRLLDSLADQLHRSISELQRMDAIVVSQVRGTAAGAGVGLAAAADIVLSAESARFVLAYTGIGFSPDGGASLLTTTLGLHRVLHLALLNPVLTARQAQESGLVAQIHPDDDLEQATTTVVKQLLAGSRPAQAATKRLLREAALPSPETALRQETLSIRTCAESPDGREGIAAFVAKRPPSFPSVSPAARS
ncbi:enoyl-CoA hydratase-related protein [Kineosporia babensis]|uniref:Enoyl-CoA hydratase-related protein n=1 Tax=Kineosporia babensis TaxID=499548 RepID=A0A9X1NHD4_9ACTN|nr:enoyl-CoA hydratase-related protein [Kineosporia babensis]MCD5314060.1 enoyl-CoA hydratase-related protein [Kineosporia babensis]